MFDYHLVQGRKAMTNLSSMTTTTTIFIHSHLRQVTEDRQVHHRLLKENNAAGMKY